MFIRPVSPDDAPQVCGIYNHYVRSSIATFEETPVADTEMASRIAAATEQLPWLVAEIDGSIAGYAYAAWWKPRSAYRFTVETSIYLHPDQARRGLGFELYQALVGELAERGLHCLIGGISLPNAASIALHEKLGFEYMGSLREVGRKFERWIDVGYWVLTLRGYEDAHE